MDSAIRPPATTCHTPDGRPVLVAVQATDPIARAGAVAYLQTRSGNRPDAKPVAAVRPAGPAAAPAKPAARATAEGGAAGPGQLEDRERDVLRLLAEGFTTVEIAARLNYSERTVKNIIHQLLTRLNLRNRTHAVAFALRNGLL